jgi:hypothetical protein
MLQHATSKHLRKLGKYVFAVDPVQAVLWNRKDLLRFRFQLWKSLVPVPDPDITVLNKIYKKAQNLAFTMSGAAYKLFLRKLASHFLIFRFLYYILCWIRIQIRFRNRKNIPVPVPLRQKVIVPAVPAPQHYVQVSEYFYIGEK